jgi:hypothetical protein
MPPPFQRHSTFPCPSPLTFACHHSAAWLPAARRERDRAGFDCPVNVVSHIRIYRHRRLPHPKAASTRGRNQNIAIVEQLKSNIFG